MSEALREIETVEPHTIAVPDLLSAVIDELVVRFQAVNGGDTDSARKCVERSILTRGAAAIREELGA